jgi:bacillithiol synthase
MSGKCIMRLAFKEISKTTDLFLDYIDDFDKLKDFFSYPPYDEGSYRKHFERLVNRRYHRDVIADILKEQNRKFGNRELTISSIDRFRRDDTFVVFTGQQVGLFGGPLYTLYKAMTAINTARYLTMTTPYTFLPFFWIEGEDHDFEEVRTVRVINRSNEILQLSYEPEIPYQGQCVGEMVLDGNIGELIEQFDVETIPTEFKPEILEKLKECYEPGRTMSESFAMWMAYLLGPYGLILVDPSEARLKELALPVYHKALEKHESDIMPAINRSSQKLKDTGYHVQVGHRPETLNFFYNKPRRTAFDGENGNYILRDADRKFSKKELEDFLREEVKNFSPNVILRPQVQDHLFPTALYVAGPAEIAYFAQFAEIYDLFDTPMPIIYPRKSLTLVENRISRLMDKYGINSWDVFGNREELEKKILLREMPDDLRNALLDTRDNISRQLDVLQKSAEAFDPNLKGPLGKLKGRINREISQAESKITGSVEEKNRIITDQIDKIFNNLLPDGVMQERYLNILSFLYKYHNRLIYSLMELTCCKHESSHIIWKVDV